MKALSTSFTFFIKITVPIVVFICSVFLIFFIAFETEYWFLALLSGAIGFVTFWLFGNVKKVEIDDSNIFVSNYLITEKIPLLALKDVYEDKAFSTSFIRLRFKYKTKFGQEIKFVPHTIKNYFHSHPTVIELRKHIN